MKHFKTKLLSVAVAAICAESALITNVAYAQSSDLEEVVVTGVRGKPRSVSDSPVPVDVFNAETIESISYSDTNDILQTLVPSYSADRSPIADGATFIRPASLRGLPTDKTLVLVNSKRRHRASLVEIGGSGTQGPDVATIPAEALKNIEVLRDGAAAQYGSDAIAGVINFILKDNSEGGSFSVNYGEYYEGDGEQATLSGNIGFALGENGFLSISGEYTDNEATSRGEQYCELFFCLDPSNPLYETFINQDTTNDPVLEARIALAQDPDFLAASRNASLEGDVVQPWGQPNFEGTKLFFNSGYDVSDSTQVYAFGNYTQSEGDGSFFYRFPFNGTVEDLRTENGDIYNPLDIFPGGFTPRFFGEIEDYSLAGGIKGEFDSTFTYDLSARYGYNEIEYTLRNTINPSLGPDSPTSFKPGSLSNEEFQIQADFVKEFDSGLVVAFGATYLDEEYDISTGELSSYEAGPYASADPFGFCDDNGNETAAGLAVIANGSTLDCDNPEDAVYNIVGVGSNGFPGFSPDFSDTYSRDSYGVYVDVSKDVTDKLFLQGALRYEDYSDFGDELVGKIAAQYDINDVWGFRASIGTGFRAPTPGQQGTTNVSTRLPNGFPVATGLFPASSDVAQALGASPLDAETSLNYTFGFTANYDAFSLTVDFYRIEIEDRTFAVSTRNVSTDPTDADAFANFQALQNAGVVGAESIGGVFFFANAFDTITSGVDIVATAPYEWSNGQSTDFTASINFNKTEFDSDPSEFLNPEDQFDFENFDPEWRATLTAVHHIGDLSLLARANYYGESENSNNNGEVTADNPNGLTYQDFDPVVFVDLEASYRVNDNFTVSLGGRNIFDEFPDEDEIGDYGNGRIYPSDTIVDWQGGYYYLRLKADF
ncbi:TonB-dependent receptor [Sessilibacter sp. MAH1]